MKRLIGPYRALVGAVAIAQPRRAARRARGCPRAWRPRRRAAPARGHADRAAPAAPRGASAGRSAAPADALGTVELAVPARQMCPSHAPSGAKRLRARRSPAAVGATCRAGPSAARARARGDELAGSVGELRGRSSSAHVGADEQRVGAVHALPGRQLAEHQLGALSQVALIRTCRRRRRPRRCVTQLASVRRLAGRAAAEDQQVHERVGAGGTAVRAARQPDRADADRRAGSSPAARPGWPHRACSGR